MKVVKSCIIVFQNKGGSIVILVLWAQLVSHIIIGRICGIVKALISFNHDLEIYSQLVNLSLLVVHKHFLLASLILLERGYTGKKKRTSTHIFFKFQSNLCSSAKQNNNNNNITSKLLWVGYGVYANLTLPYKNR